MEINLIEKRANTTIVFLAGIEWDFLKQGQQYLAESFSEQGYSVIYVEPMLHRRIRFSDFGKIVKRLYSSIKQKKTTFTNDRCVEILSPVALPSTNIFFRFINDCFFIKKIGKQIKNRSNDKVICYIWWPEYTFLKLSQLINAEKIIYSCVDNHSESKNCPIDLPKYEKNLVKDADLVVVTSNFLFNKWRNRAKNIIIRPRAVDYQLYSASNNGITEKIDRLIFFGGISDRIDIGLINSICDKGIEIDLYGEWRLSKINLKEINANYKGCVPPEELPLIIRKYDGFIWPYKINDYTKGILPAKIYECFSSGKPIITTRLPAMEKYKDLVYIIDSSNDVLSLQKKLNSEIYLHPKRVKVAKTHSWEDLSINEISILDSLVENK